MPRPASPSSFQTPPEIGRMGQSVGAWQPLGRRYRPPCLEPSFTVSRLRPFFRRRESVARPQRVAIRARKPCLLIRRRLRGRYDGFMVTYPSNEPENLAVQGHLGQG